MENSKIAPLDMYETMIAAPPDFESTPLEQSVEQKDTSYRKTVKFSLEESVESLEIVSDSNRTLSTVLSLDVNPDIQSQDMDAFQLLSEQFQRLGMCISKEDTIVEDDYIDDAVVQVGEHMRMQTTTRGTKIELPIVNKTSPMKDGFCENIDIKKVIQYSEYDDGLIGEGGFGRVFQGNWNGKQVAVKIFKEEYQYVLGKTGSRIMDGEFNVLGRLHHENIVECYGGNTEAGKRCIVMELMEKGSLDAYIHKNRQPIKLVNYYKILIAVCKALAYLHPTIVHRDIKPSNILLDAQGMVKLSDFGLSKFKEGASTAMNSDIVGTPSYIAPEVFTGEFQPGPKSDIYAVAILMHEMYSRCRPWKGLQDFEAVYKIMINQRLQIPEGCPHELSKMMQRCWDPNPNNRPSAQQLYEWSKVQLQVQQQKEHPVLLYKNS